MKEQLNILVRMVQEAKEGGSIFEDGLEYVTLLQLEDQDLWHKAFRVTRSIKFQVHQFFVFN